MKINAQLVMTLRRERSWSQEELAIASGLNLRTIQRVENRASASLQTRKALASALEIDARALDGVEVRLQPCPVCGSDRIHQYDTYFSDPSAAAGATLLPGLGSVLWVAKLCPCVCQDCGHVRIFASDAARKKLATAKGWKRVGT